MIPLKREFHRARFGVQRAAFRPNGDIIWPPPMHNYRYQDRVGRAL